MHVHLVVSWMHVHLGACMGTGTRCLPLLFSALFFETGSLTEPETYDLAKTASHSTPGIPCLHLLVQGNAGPFMGAVRA